MSDDLEKFISFLTTSPLYSSIELSYINTISSNAIISPELIIYCDDPLCNTETIHLGIDQSKNKIYLPQNNTVTLRYRCKHCGHVKKFFSLMVRIIIDEEVDTEYIVRITKIGEFPPFGPHIPLSVSKLLSGSHRELFMKGLRSEGQDFGIGAFIYYRRTLDSIKNDLIDEMIKVANTIKAPQGFIDSLKEGRKEDEFSKSVDKIKKAIPDGFKIDGHNPLTMLNKALSKGVHNKKDNECLELAQVIRTILFHLLARLTELRKEDKELKDTIKKLNKFSNSQK